MKKVGGQKAAGYTILETMIFLAVTSVLFVSAMAAIGGQQARTEFSHGVREANAKIQDMLNDVASGYYRKPGQFSCSFGPTIDTSVSKEQGTNDSCIFIGRVMALGIGTGASNDPTSVRVYNVIGNRVKSAGSSVLVRSLAPNEANPTAMTANVDIGKLPSGITVGCITTETTCNNANRSSFGAFGIFSTFGSYGTTGLKSGSVSTTLIPLDGTHWDSQSENDIVTAVNHADSSTKNPADGVRICLISSGSKQHAYITVGSTSNNATQVIILGGKDCSVNT